MLEFRNLGSNNHSLCSCKEYNCTNSYHSVNEKIDEYFKKKEANRPSQEQIDLWVKVGVLDENMKPGKLWAERGKYALPDTLEKWKKMAEQQKQTSNA